MNNDGFYWIETSWDGPEIARLRSDLNLFFTTRMNGDGEVITVSNQPEYVTVLAGPLEFNS